MDSYIEIVLIFLYLAFLK